MDWMQEMVLFLVSLSLLIQHIYADQSTNKHSLASPEGCVKMIHLDFEFCSKKGLAKSKSYSATSGIINNLSCAKRLNCKPQFKIMYVKLEPYYNMKDQINEMLSGCCGYCSKLTRIGSFNNTTEIDITSIKNTDFVFPFLATTSSTKLFGFYFIPIISVSSAYLFTPKAGSGTETFIDLVNEVRELWPFVAVCLVLALVSGCIAWLLDTWSNEEEFPRAFYIGGFEGFWWAFISMTTVGYGDKSPKSWPARIFAIIWILFGITICSMFTAALTTAISSVLNPETPTIDGKKIGSLKNRMYEALVIAQYGGMLHTVDSANLTSGIDALVDLTADGTIDGFLLDTYLINKFRKEAKGNHKEAKKVARKLNGHGSTLVADKALSLSMGLLVNNKTDYDYFKSYFFDNRLEIEACLTYAVNNIYKPEAVSSNYLFSVSNGTFIPMMYACFGILAFLVIIGIVFDLVTKKLKSGGARICDSSIEKDKTRNIAT